MSQPIDLKQYLLMIADKKDVDATFSLDQGCSIMADDPKPLIKLLNYFYNFVQEATKATMEVSLELRDKNYMLTFISTAAGGLGNTDLPAQVNEALKEFNASAEVIKDGESSMRLAVTFNR